MSGDVMTDERLAEIEARAKDATPGPWEPEHRSVIGNDVVIVDDCATAGWDVYPANQDFIAHARADVPALVTEVRRLRAELAQARAIIEGRPNPPTTAEKMAHRCDAADGWDANGAPTR
jgi:hypothetical protein